MCNFLHREGSYLLNKSFNKRIIYIDALYGGMLHSVYTLLRASSVLFKRDDCGTRQRRIAIVIRGDRNERPTRRSAGDEFIVGRGYKSYSTEEL